MCSWNEIEFDWLFPDSAGKYWNSEPIVILRILWALLHILLLDDIREQLSARS